MKKSRNSILSCIILAGVTLLVMIKFQKKSEKLKDYIVTYRKCSSSNNKYLRYECLEKYCGGWGKI